MGFSTFSDILKGISEGLLVDLATPTHIIKHHNDRPGERTFSFSAASWGLVNSELGRMVRAQTVESEGLASKLLL